MTQMFMLAMAFVFFAGCAQQPEARNALNNLPQWYQEPTVLGDAYAAAASARPNASGDLELQKIEAAAVARAELARQMQVRVKDMFKRATQELGLGEDRTVDHAMQYVTKQVSDVTLQNSHQKKLFLDSDTGTLYVLYAMNEQTANSKIKSLMQSSLGSEEAMWQKFQATQMWKELDGASGSVQ